MDLIELKGMTWSHARGYDCVVAAAENYAQANDVKVNWDKRSLQAFADAPILELAEQYDFIVLDHPHVGLIAEQGALLPIEFEASAETSLGGSEESYFWGGQCWARAIDASCQMAVYRPDLLKELPLNWEEFKVDGARFRPLTPLLPVDAFDMLMTLVAGRGETQLPFNKSEFVSKTNGIYALEVMRDLYNLGPSEQVDMNPIHVLEVLSTENSFACSPCHFGYINYVQPNFRDHQLTYFDIPKSQGFESARPILGGAGIGVSAKTKHPSEALKFANWIASEPVQSGVYLANSGQPANKRTWQAQRHNPQYQGFFDGAFYTIDNAWTRPRDIWFLSFVDDVCEIMSSYFTQSIPSEDFLERINQLYRHHLSGGK